MAEPQELPQAIRNQGRLLGETHQRVDSLTESVHRLAQQQAGQQAQLTQISASLSEITERLTLLSAPPTAGPESPRHCRCRGWLVSPRIALGSPSWFLASQVEPWTGLLRCGGVYGQATYERFLQDFAEVFDHPNEGRSSGELLLQMRQGTRSVAEYSLDFRTVAAGSGWNEPALVVAFRNGLHPDLLKELACRDEGLDLDKLIALAIRLDQLKRGVQTVRRASSVRPRPLACSWSLGALSRTSPRASAVCTEEEPMQVDSARLTPAERSRRRQEGLCLYCGEEGHLLRNCSTRPRRNLPAAPPKGREKPPSLRCGE
ncbi:hypothetical protein NFI96_025570 [Prochilodus magdalenae]|nr:hypothetical protein NFI96_025570 [Prochilodus magdalenae]